MDRDALDAAIMRAHVHADCAKLAALYAKAADDEEAAGNTDAVCFFLTQAFVFALEDGAKTADDLKARLSQYGRVPED